MDVQNHRLVGSPYGCAGTRQGNHATRELALAGRQEVGFVGPRDAFSFRPHA